MGEILTTWESAFAPHGDKTEGVIGILAAFEYLMGKLELGGLSFGFPMRG